MRNPLLILLVLTAGCAWRPHSLATDQAAAQANGLPAVRLDAPPLAPANPAFDGAFGEFSRVPSEVDRLPPAGKRLEPNARDRHFSAFREPWEPSPFEPRCPAFSGDVDEFNRFSPPVKRLPPIDDWPERSAIDGPVFAPYQTTPLNDQPFDPYRAPEPHLFRGIFNDVCSDYVHYYSGESLGKLAIGVGAAAALANTSADESLRSLYQDRIGRSQVLHAPKILGEGLYTIPVFAASAFAGSYFDEVPLGHGVGEWGSRSLRTILVGAPPMLAMQYVLGASRPGETSAGSHWKPFSDTNGVSGHAFIGAVPFLSAAKMTEDPFWKAGLYFASVLPGLSRINDDDHYTSQVILGWWMAYLAANAVDETQLAKTNLTIQPVFFPDNGVGIGIEYRR